MPSLLDRMQAQKPAPAAPAEKGRGDSAPTSPALAPPAPPQRAPVSAEQKELRRKLHKWLLERILAGLSSPGELKRDDATLALLSERFAAALAAANVKMPPDEARQFERDVLDELIGFGPLEPLLQDPTVTEVMVNGPRQVFVEQEGIVRETEVQFEDDAHVMRIIDRIIRPLGRHVDRKWPMADARLPDGSRVNVIIPPSAIDGPTITIRKFSKSRLTTEDLVKFGSLTPNMAEFLRACVIARLNVVVAGGTGSGKTTLLNILSNFIPDHDRVVTIEDSAELQLAKPHVVRLEARPPDPDGTGRVMIRDLVINALRMRPERIVVGEVRDAAALDMLQAMNTGHDGSLTTLHANTPRDAISRLETMSLMAGIEFPIKVIREQIAAAIDLIVQQARLRDGSRKVVQVTEVQGMEGDIIVMQDVFRFVEQGLDLNGKVIGEFQPSGIRPKFMPRLETADVHLPMEIFTAGAAPLRR
ncbi:MAG: CpaF family protein [Chloroflexi bacterium]|nr:CpaF family protein [Chloroflexota bacterium]